MYGGLAVAQPTNYYVTRASNSRIWWYDGQVAEGWASWHIGDDTLRPDYMVAPSDRTLNGEAQAYSSFLAAHEAGLYQSVSGLTPGAPLTFTANVWVWSTRNDLDPAVSEDPGSVTIEVGIDTTGAIDPEGAGIIWSEPVEIYDEFTPVLVTAAPSGDLATVFIKTTVGETRLVTDVYIDDASLITTDGIIPSTDQATVESPITTEEAAPTVEAIATEAVEPTVEVFVTEETAPTTEGAPADPNQSPFLSTITHTVQSGDSYDRLRGFTAARWRPSGANNVGPDDDIIYPGDVLIVPVPVPAVVETVDPASVTDIAPEPTALPTEEPTVEPTIEPTVEATVAPTEEVSGLPTEVIEVQRTYTVQRGDSLMEIAKRFEVNVIELGRLNNVLNYNLIYVGQVLTCRLKKRPLPKQRSRRPARQRRYVTSFSSETRFTASQRATA